MAASSKSIKEKRRATRKKVLVRAEIAGGRLGKQWQPCILKDLSDTGCQIVGSNVELIAGSFLLQSEIHDRPQKFQVAWRSKRAIGARFVGFEDSVDKRPEPSDALDAAPVTESAPLAEPEAMPEVVPATDAPPPVEVAT